MAESGCYILMGLLACGIYLGFRWSVTDRDGVRPLLSINSILLICFLIYVWLSAALSVIFDNFALTWVRPYSGASNALQTLTLSFFALVIYICGYRFFSRTGRGRVANESTEASTFFGVVALALTLMGLALKFYVFLAMGGLSGSVTRMSPGISESLEVADVDYIVSTVRNLSGIAEAAAAWMLVVAIRRRRGILLWGGLFSLIVILTYISLAKRTLLVEPFVAVILACHFYVMRLRLSLMPFLIMAILAFGMVSLFLRAVLPLSINEVNMYLDDVPWAHGSWIGFYFYSLEFATFEAMTVSVRESDQIIAMFGSVPAAFYTTNIEPFFYVIPRIIWPGKPLSFVDLSMATTAVMFGLPLIESPWGTAASYIGNSWVLGGSFGVAAYSTMLAWIAARGDSFLIRSGAKNKDVAINLYSILVLSVFLLYRQGGLGYTFIQVVPNQIGYLTGVLVLLALSSTRKSTPSKTSTSSSQVNYLNKN